MINIYIIKPAKSTKTTLKNKNIGFEILIPSVPSLENLYRLQFRKHRDGVNKMTFTYPDSYALIWTLATNINLFMEKIISIFSLLTGTKVPKKIWEQFFKSNNFNYVFSRL